MSRQTYYDVLKNKQKKRPTRTTIVSMTKGIDKHRFAHLAFDLDLPEDMVEMEGALKDIYEIALKMDEAQRREAVGYLKRMVEEGGGRTDEDPAMKTGYG